MTGLPGDAYRWAGAWSRQGHTRLPDFKADNLRRRWDELIERRRPPIHAAPGSRPARNLALRLRGSREEFLHFTTDFTVTFSNNTAEQAIRMINVKTKVSGGFRTLRGAATFLAIRGYISTARKNGVRAYATRCSAISGSRQYPRPE